MSTAITEQTALVPQVVIRYDVSEDQIAKLAADYAGVSFDAPASYAAGVKAIAHVRGLRTAVEARRKDLKEDSLKVGRMIDAAAKKLTAALEAVEEPLKRLKATVDETKEQARRKEEDRIRAEQAAAAKAAQETEDRRLADERARLAAETAAFEARRKAADEERAAREEAERVERERVAAVQREQQAAIDAAKKEIEERERKIREDERAAAQAISDREEAARVAEALRLKKEAEEREAAERAQRDRVTAAEAEAAGLARAAAEQARLDALRPDVDRVLTFAGELRKLAGRAPAVESDEARAAVAWVCSRLDAIAGQVETRFASAVAT